MLMGKWAVVRLICALVSTNKKTDEGNQKVNGLFKGALTRNFLASRLFISQFGTPDTLNEFLKKRCIQYTHRDRQCFDDLI
jgi:hypothetical protein